MGNTPDQYILCKTVADYCGVTERTVNQWLATGNLKAELNNGEQRVCIGDLMDFMHRNQLAIPFELMQFEQPSQGSTSVLIVDTDRSVAQKIAEVMTSLSLRVAKVSNGFDATLHCLQKKPDLVTLDLRLDDMSAIELIENLVNNQSKRAKILVISDGMPSIIAKATEAGADAVIPKPIDTDLLKRSTRILLNL